MFKWADNAIKLNIAKTNAGKDASEKDVYEAYVRLNGKVNFTPEFVPAVAIEEEVPHVVLEVKEVKKPKKESVVKKAIKKVIKKK